MTEQTIRAIEAILSRGERVELLAGPGGEVKVLRIAGRGCRWEKNKRRFPVRGKRLDRKRHSGYNETRRAVTLCARQGAANSKFSD